MNFTIHVKFQVGFLWSVYIFEKSTDIWFDFYWTVEGVRLLGSALMWYKQPTNQSNTSNRRRSVVFSFWLDGVMIVQRFLNCNRGTYVQYMLHTAEAVEGAESALPIAPSHLEPPWWPDRVAVSAPAAYQFYFYLLFILSVCNYCVQY
jgi:hypothetical protein